MPITEKQRRQIIAAFCIVFYLLLLLKLRNGFLLFQLQPILFNTRFDLLTWLFMTTGLHQWLLQNPPGWIAFDIVFYSMPAVYWFCYKMSVKASAVVAVVMLLVNWIYIQCYTLYPANSIEGFTAWLLFPFLFMAVNLKTFYFVLHALRYFFLFFFVSAALWKFWQGGIFHLQEMSAILVFQHKEYLASSPGYWYTNFIYWLIQHPAVSYCLYAAATAIELAFVIGFFTKKYDSVLIVAALLFLVMDVLVMRIPYFEIAPFLFTLYFSKYTQPLQSAVQRS